jgi:predicted secreted protein
MHWGTLIATYFTLWWTVLFAVLPFGVRREEKPESGHDHGAPTQPMLIRKVIWTSIASAVILAVFYALFASGLLSWRALVGTPDDGSLSF